MENIENMDYEILDVLKKELETLKNKNTILYRKKKNLVRTNLRLKKQLKNQIVYITSLENTQTTPCKFKPSLKTIPEDNCEDIWDNFEKEWDCI